MLRPLVWCQTPLVGQKQFNAHIIALHDHTVALYAGDNKKHNAWVVRSQLPYSEHPQKATKPAELI